MELLLLILGVFVGFCAGVFATAKAQVDIDKEAAKDGVIKLGGVIYKLEKIDV